MVRHTLFVKSHIHSISSTSIQKSQLAPFSTVSQAENQIKSSQNGPRSTVSNTAGPKMTTANIPDQPPISVPNKENRLVGLTSRTRTEKVCNAITRVHSADPTSAACLKTPKIKINLAAGRKKPVSYANPVSCKTDLTLQQRAQSIYYCKVIRLLG